MEDFFYESRAEWCSDDVRRQTRVAPALRSALRSVAELRENRQTQCNLREQEDAQKRKDDMYNLKSTNKPEVWSCHVQPQFKAPEQTVCCQDYWDQQKLSSACNEYVYIRILYIQRENRIYI